MLSGRYTVWSIDAAGKWHKLFSKRNLLMATWGMAAARALGFGDNTFRINKMYVEYENVASPGDPVTVPTFDDKDSRAYYDNLTAPKDYLRIPIQGTPALSVATGFESVFSAGEGNKLTFQGQSAGTVGINGTTFSDSVNSKVYGIAMVAAPSDADKTKDVIVTRGYYDVADQRVKQASGQIGITWDIAFKTD